MKRLRYSYTAPDYKVTKAYDNVGRCWYISMHGVRISGKECRPTIVADETHETRAEGVRRFLENNFEAAIVLFDELWTPTPRTREGETC